MESSLVLLALFISLTCFMAVNIALGLILWRFSGHSIYSNIVKYWAAVILFLAFQFVFQDGQLQIIMAYGACILPMLFIYHLVTSLLQLKERLSLFMGLHLLAMVTSLILWKEGQGFTQAALPLSISVSLPLFYSLKLLWFTHRSQSTVLQKILGVLLILWIPHCYSFAFFRMEESAQLFGWLTSYTLFDMMAVLLPAIAIEESFRTEKERLEKQVQLRTLELKDVLGDKETLIKILIHDISNPLTVMKWHLGKIRNNLSREDQTSINKVLRSQEIVENIVRKVKVLEFGPPPSSGQKPISFMKCLEELHFIFEKPLEAKRIRLEITDETRGNDLIFADQFSLTHHILSNFLNNAIKFSFPDSCIRIMISADHKQLKVKIKDKGMGMNQEKVKLLLLQEQVESSSGTEGETGSGLGLSIAKNLLKSLGAQLEITSQEYGENVIEHGTCIKLTFPLAMAQTQGNLFT